MPLSREDCLSILRHLQLTLREADPGAFEVVAAGLEPIQDPHRLLLAYLARVRQVLAERSGGNEGKILDLMNASVRTEDNSPITSVRLALTGLEREHYGQEFVDLATLPDRREFLAGLERIQADIQREISGSGEMER